MHIAFFEVKEDWEREFLMKRLKRYNVVFFPEVLSEKNAAKARGCEIVSVFIGSKVTKGIIDKLPKMQMLVTRSTGYDHIDVEACHRKFICVSTVPAYGEHTVAEHAFALILTLSRKIHKAYLKAKNDDFSLEGLKGFDLHGKTLGVIGVGKIGKQVIQIANGFGMHVLAYEKHPKKELAKQLGFQSVSLQTLLKKSDIVSLHVPLTKETHHLINHKTIRLIKKNALLINTSRGEVVETAAVIDALNSGVLSGAGLDVIEGEQLMKEEHFSQDLDRKELKQIVQDHKLLHDEKVVFTPHMAFYSQEALERILHTTIENIRDFMHKKSINCV